MEDIKIDLHQPGIEPRASAWKALMLPLHHWCLCQPLLRMYNISTQINTFILLHSKIHHTLYMHLTCFQNSVFKCDHVLIIRPCLSLKPNKITCISATRAAKSCASQDLTKQFVNRGKTCFKIN